MATKIWTLEGGKIGVETPWNAKVIAEAKRRMGRWGGVATKDGRVQAWVMDASHKEAMQQLVDELFPGREALVERTVEFATIPTEWSRGSSYHSPKIDGYDLVEFGRDSFYLRCIPEDAPLQVLEIVENKLDTGGSRKNPWLTGQLTVRVRCRPQAVCEWTEGVVEVIS